MADWIKAFRQGTAARLRASAAVTALVPADRIDDTGYVQLDENAPLPVVSVSIRRFRRQRDGEGVPQFITAFELQIEMAVKAGAGGGMAAAAVEVAADLDDLRDAIEEALLCDAEWIKSFQSIDDGDWQALAVGQGKRVVAAGQLVFTGTMPETFEPRIPDRFRKVHVAQAADAPDRLRVDLPQIEAEAALGGAGALQAEAARAIGAAAALAGEGLVQANAVREAMAASALSGAGVLQAEGTTVPALAVRDRWGVPVLDRAGAYVTSRV